MDHGRCLLNDDIIKELYRIRTVLVLQPGTAIDIGLGLELGLGLGLGLFCSQVLQQIYKT